MDASRLGRRPDAGVEIFLLGCLLALTVGAVSGFVVGVVVAYTRASPYSGFLVDDDFLCVVSVNFLAGEKT